jgi:hypothetical protein
MTTTDITGWLTFLSPETGRRGSVISPKTAQGLLARYRDALEHYVPATREEVEARLADDAKQAAHYAAHRRYCGKGCPCGLEGEG